MHSAHILLVSLPCFSMYPATSRTFHCTQEALNKYSLSQNVPSPSSTLTRNLLKTLSTSLFLGSQQDRTNLQGYYMLLSHHHTDSRAKNLPEQGAKGEATQIP